MSTQPVLSEYEDRWTLDVRNLVVSRVSIDFGVTLLLSDEVTSFELRIEEPFLLNDIGAARSTTLNPAEPQSLDQLLLGRVHAGCTALTLWKTGSLDLVFEDRSSIQVPHSQNFEAWTLTETRSDGLRIVSTPGGGLAIWPADEVATT